MTTLAVELSASRLLGNVFGNSNLVWANVIGLILLYLTVGYFIGGRWADRSPHFTTFYRIIIWAAFLNALIPIVARPVITTAASAVVDAEAALALGSFISVLILFSIPITLLGCVSPFAIRLAVTDIEHSGQTSGHIYALSTLGSLLGTFLPGLLLIPAIGTFQTFILFSGILYGIAFIGLIKYESRAAVRSLWMPIAIAFLASLVLRGPLRPAEAGAKLLFEDESAYNYIQVQEDGDGMRYLYLNEGQGVHSQWHPDQLMYQGTWDYFLAAPYFNNPPYTPEDVESLAIIGLAGGTIARQYTAVYGNIPIDGIEIDPGIVEAGERFFGMNETELPNLTIYVQDGRYILKQIDRDYSIIAIDAYRPPYIPWHLTTVEFFEEVREHLSDNGVVAINVGRTNTDRRLVDALTTTMLEVFPTIHAIDVPNSFNTILVGTMTPTTSTNLINNLNIFDDTEEFPILHDVLSASIENTVPVVTSDIIFTDNQAPVETLVDSIVLNFLLSGDLDEIRPED